MRVQTIIICILLFSVTMVLLFNVGNDLFDENDGYNITIDDRYKVESGVYKETTDLVSDMSDKTPGGIDSPQLTDVSQTNSDVLGLNVMSLLFKSPGIAKKIIFGEKNETSGEIIKYGLTTEMGINPIFGNLLIITLVLIIAIILISSVLRNRW